MKKSIVICLMAILLLAVQLPITAQDVLTVTKSEDALTGGVREIVMEEATQPIYDSVELANSSAGTGVLTEARVDLKELLMNSLLSEAESVELTAYSITPEQFKSVLQDIIYSEPSLFYVSEGFTYWTSSDGNIAKYKPNYTMTGEALVSAREYYESEIARILTESGALAAEDDLTKALLLHDYLAAHYRYDTDYAIYDVYGMLKNGKAVCQGYTLLYDALLTECGIEVGYAHSDAMKHIWNLVRIGTEYYHVDATWADPVPDRYSLVSHEYFLRSDTDINTEYTDGNGHVVRSAHYGWTASDGIVCGSTKYDESVFSSARSPFVWCEGNVYYIDFSSGDLCVYTDALQAGTKLISASDMWMVSGSNSSYYQGTYSGLVSHGGKLYFNSTNSIDCYDPKEDVMTEDIVTVEAEAGDIVGLLLTAENELSYALAADAVSAVSEMRIYTLPEEPKYHAADVNRDGILNVSDVNDLLVYLAGMSENEAHHVDVNDDGFINVEDLNTVLVVLATME